MSESKEKKGFLCRLIEKLDKKMEEKAKAKPCCSKKKNDKGDSCCSK